jgi:hypothetical protein
MWFSGFCSKLRAPHRGTSLGPFVWGGSGGRAFSLCSFFKLSKKFVCKPIDTAERCTQRYYRPGVISSTVIKKHKIQLNNCFSLPSYAALYMAVSSNSTPSCCCKKNSFGPVKSLYTSFLKFFCTKVYRWS